MNGGWLPSLTSAFDASMELIGLLLAAPVTFVASLACAALISAVFKFLPVGGRLLVAGSLGAITVIALEIAFLVTMGAKGTYAHFGHPFIAMHFLGFLLGPPAVATLIFNLASRLSESQWLRISSATLCCWMASLAALLGHVALDEAIVGIDAGKPFYMTPPDRPNRIAPLEPAVPVSSSSAPVDQTPDSPPAPGPGGGRVL